MGSLHQLLFKLHRSFSLDFFPTPRDIISVTYGRHSLGFLGPKFVDLPTDPPKHLMSLKDAFVTELTEAGCKGSILGST